MKPAGLQERFLNILRKEAIPATFFLINGFQMKGVVKAFDPYTLVLDSNGTQEMVYKHALSTIIPSRVVDLSLLTELEEA